MAVLSADCTDGPAPRAAARAWLPQGDSDRRGGVRRLALEAKVGEPGDAKRLPPKAAPPSTAHDWWADDGRMASPCDGTEVSGLAAVLEEMVRLGAESPSSPFRSAWPAAVSVAEYVDILHGGFRCSNGCFVVALVYLDRAMKRNKEIAVGPLTCHRLLAASLTLAAKFQDDSCCHTAYYADICGVPERELACLERAMLRLLDYRLAVHPGEFESYRRILSSVGGGQRRS